MSKLKQAVFRNPGILLVIFIAGGCATKEQPEYNQLYIVEKLEPPTVLCEPMVPVTKSPSVRLRVSPNRITPHDGNDYLAEATLSWSGGSVSSLEIVDLDTCEVQHKSRPITSQTSISWNGSTDRGTPAQPGLYLVRATEVSGATAYGTIVVGYRDDPCTVAAENVVPLFSSDFKLNQPRLGPARQLHNRQGGRLCLSVTGTAGEIFAPKITVNGATILNSSAAIGDTRQISLGVEVGPSSALAVGGSGSFTLSAGILPSEDEVVEALSSTEILCEGRLEGFEHPFYPGLGRRPVLRGGVPVYCAARFGPRPDNQDSDISVTLTRQDSFGAAYADLEPSPPEIELTPYRAMLPTIPGLQGQGPGFLDPGDVRPVPPPTGVGEIVWVNGVTQPDGTFSIPITAADLENQHIHPDQPLISVSANCDDSYKCGAITTGDSSTSISGARNLRIRNVPDYYDGILEARLVSNARPATPLDADDNNERINDFPVVIHEPFDPLNEDSTDYLVWLLSGQPNRLVDSEGNSIPIEDQCERMPRSSRCVPFRDDCRWTPECIGEDREGEVSCLQTNILKIMLDNGYDVWLVNTLPRDLTPAEAAAYSPKAYQAIQDYPVVDEDRRIAVTGLSAGGVIARIALRLWERKDELPSINGTELELLSLAGDDQIDDSPEQVGLYVSFDAPHRGALLPVTLQAYLKDNQIPQSQTLTDLVNSDTAKQLLKNYVRDEIDTGCFIGQSQARDCTLREVTSENEAIATHPRFESDFVGGDEITREGLDALIEESVDLLSVDGTSIVDALAPDGLPKTIPSIAISNGRFDQQIRELESDVVLQINIRSINVRTQSLRIHVEQPAGSTLPLCQASEITAPLEPFLLYELLADYCSDKCGDGILGTVCGAACYASAIVPPVGLSQKRVEVNVVPAPPIDAPTFIPTESALLAPRDVADLPATNLEDALWRTDDPPHFHFDVTEEACRFTMYYLDGYLKNDRDGYPSCTPHILSDCASGGRRPGQIVDPTGTMNSYPEAFCDCDDFNAEIGPRNGNSCRLRRQLEDIDLPDRVSPNTG